MNHFSPTTDSHPMETPDLAPPRDVALSPEERLAVSEQRLRLLADTAKDVVWSMSPAGEITYISQAIEKLRGLTPDEAMRQPLDQILTPTSQAEVIQYFGIIHAAAARKEEPPVFRGDLEYYRQDGSTFWTEVFAFPLTNPQGALIEILGVTRDISERKQHEESLMRAREVAEQANAAKSRFLAHVSHELRTPMTTLLSWIDLAIREAPAPPVREALGKAQDAGRLLLGVINDLLDLSRMEHGGFALHQAPFSLRAMVEKVSAMVRPAAEAKGLQCRIAVDPRLSDHFLGDELRLMQALLNLLNNAVKFTPSGQVEISVTDAGAEESRRIVCFKVTDTGIGIPLDWQSRLFHELVQVPDVSAAPGRGTGLGLTICKRLASTMGGSVGLSSTPGVGSTFWFTASLSLAEKGAPLFSDQQAPTRQNFAGVRILVVEDDPSIREAVGRLLTSISAQADIAENGAIALERLRETSYDLILMDLIMPIMGGEECTRLIRRHLKLPDLPIIGLTAAGFAEDRDRCLAAGMNDYLTKPFDFDDLVLRIEKYCLA
jgi:PAS domain S-box-containing protein